MAGLDKKRTDLTGREESGADRHHLRREMGLTTATILVVASMIGTGIFTTSGLIMEALGDPKAMLLCWLIGGFFALSGALCYGELGAMFPRAGGDYVFLRESFGRLMGFLSGWISLIVGFSAPIAAASMAAAAYFFSSLPVAKSPNLPFLEASIVSISPLTLLAVSFILLFSLIHSRSLSFGSRVQNLLTFFKVAVILVFVGGGFWVGDGSVAHFTSEGGAGLIFSGSFADSLIFVSFAYSGWNAAAYLGGEIKAPSRNIPFSLIIGTLLVIVLYLLTNMVFIYALSEVEMSGVIEVGAKSALFLFGGKTGRLFSGAVTVCLLSVISAMIMAGPRVYYAMSKDGSFFALFGRLTGTHGTPTPSILLQTAIAVILVVTSTFDKLLLYVGFTLSLFAVLTVTGMIFLRIKFPSLKRPYRTFGYPVTPVLFILGNLWIIAFFTLENPLISLYGAGTILAGIVVFYCFDRRGKGFSRRFT